MYSELERRRSACSIQRQSSKEHPLALTKVENMPNRATRAKLVGAFWCHAPVNVTYITIERLWKYIDFRFYGRQLL